MAFHPTRLLSYFLNTILVSFLVLALTSCQSILPENKARQSDVAIFIDAVKKNSARQSLEKASASEGRNETTRLTTPNFDHELSFFSKAVLAEPYLKGYYTTGTREENGQMVTTHTAMGEKPEVRQLQVFRNADGQILGLKMETSQDNYLFQNSLKCELLANLHKGVPVFKNYKVEGRQKMLLGDPYQFNISAKAL